MGIERSAGASALRVSSTSNAGKRAEWWNPKIWRPLIKDYFGGNNMIQSVDFIYWTNSHPEDKKRVLEALESSELMEIVVHRHKMMFHPDSQCVIVDRVYEDDAKLIKCKIPYKLMTQMMEGFDWDMTGFELLF